MVDKNEMAGGTRVYLFIRPTPISLDTDTNWKSVQATIEQYGGKVFEDCSGGAIGSEHNDLIVTAVLKEYGRVPQLINQFYETHGLSLTVYPWESPSKFFQKLVLPKPVGTSTTR